MGTDHLVPTDAFKSDLVFTEKRNIALRTTTVTVIRLIFYRVLGVEKRIADLQACNADLRRRVKSLEYTLYNYQDGQAEVLKEIQSTANDAEVKP